MKTKQVPRRKGFWVLTGNRRCQAAAMNIAPGERRRPIPETVTNFFAANRSQPKAQ